MQNRHADLSGPDENDAHSALKLDLVHRGSLSPMTCSLMLRQQFVACGYFTLAD